VATFYLPTIYAVFASCLLDLMACLMCRRRKTSTKVMPAPRREGVGGATGWDEPGRDVEALIQCFFTPLFETTGLIYPP
jgi:hypothetical protein